jgi:hypothetical protein
MWIGYYVTESIYDQYEVLCGLFELIGDDVVT